MERAARLQGVELESMERQAVEALWEEAKADIP
jgi:hypothetical protein